MCFLLIVWGWISRIPGKTTQQGVSLSLPNEPGFSPYFMKYIGSTSNSMSFTNSVADAYQWHKNRCTSMKSFQLISLFQMSHQETQSKYGTNTKRFEKTTSGFTQMCRWCHAWLTDPCVNSHDARHCPPRVWGSGNCTPKDKGFVWWTVLIVTPRRKAREGGITKIKWQTVPVLFQVS